MTRQQFLYLRSQKCRPNEGEFIFDKTKHNAIYRLCMAMMKNRKVFASGNRAVKTHRVLKRMIKAG